MGIKGFDQWLEHDESMDYDPVADAEKIVKQVEWAKMNWDTQLPECWESQVDNLIVTIKMLTEYIENNT